MIRAAFLVLAVGLLAGCSASSISSQVEAFSAGAVLRPSDRVLVVPAVEAGRESIEHQGWIRMAEAEFARRGIPTTRSQSDATAIAAVGLAIDTGRDVTSTFAIPQFGVTGYSPANTFGTVNRVGNVSTFNATTTAIPQYGVTGFVPGSRTDRVFQRHAVLVIQRRVPAGAPQTIFESRAASEGSCGMLSAVAPQLVEALFATYPEGGARRVQSEFSGNC